MAQIHPTSIVDEQAVLAEDVEVGPGCVITGRVSIAAGTRLIGSAYLQGPMTIGERNTIYPFCCIGFAPQHQEYDPRHDGAGVNIGPGNVFRESTTVHRATGEAPTTIGKDNMFMANSHVGHDTVIANDCILANGVLLGGHTVLQDRVIMGGNAGLHQHCRLGRLSMMSGIIALVQDLPPFCVSHYNKTLGSLNLIGLRRWGYRLHVKPLQQAFDVLFRQGHSNAQAVELIEQRLGHDPLCMEMAQFVRTTKRGITSYAASDAGDRMAKTGGEEASAVHITRAGRGARPARRDTVGESVPPPDR